MTGARQGCILVIAACSVASRTISYVTWLLSEFPEAEACKISTI
jgi:hypothetical protein